jgi:hypothetical protein
MVAMPKPDIHDHAVFPQGNVGRAKHRHLIRHVQMVNHRRLDLSLWRGGLYRLASQRIEFSFAISFCVTNMQWLSATGEPKHAQRMMR